MKENDAETDLLRQSSSFEQICLKDVSMIREKITSRLDPLSEGTKSVAVVSSCH